MLTMIAWASLGIAFTCAIIITIDEVRHPQKMWIMSIVWPVTSLYFSVFTVGLLCQRPADDQRCHAKHVKDRDGAAPEARKQAGSPEPDLEHDNPFG